MSTEPRRLTDRRLRRGTFTSVPALIEAIETYFEHWNDDPKPFISHKDSEGIAKVPADGLPSPQSNPQTRDYGYPFGGWGSLP